MFSSGEATEQVQPQEDFSITVENNGNNPTYKSMCKRYGKFKLVNFPDRYFTMDFSELMAKEQQLQNEFGFSKQELKHIIKQKPTLLMYKEEFQKDGRGILAIQKVLCEEMKQSNELVKNLIVKYPGILCKNEEQMREFFSILSKYGVSQQQAIRSLVEIPRLIS